MSGRVYTVGHSRHDLDALVALLAPHRIAALVDVRSRPYSRWAPAFVKRSLERELPARGVAYRFRGDVLGGLLDGKSYVERAAEPDFTAAIDELVASAAREVVALLCAEEDPARCHRRLLLAPALRRRGVEVAHLRADGAVVLDGELDGDAARQLSLF